MKTIQISERFNEGSTTRLEVKWHSRVINEKIYYFDISKTKIVVSINTGNGHVVAVHRFTR